MQNPTNAVHQAPPPESVLLDFPLFQLGVVTRCAPSAGAVLRVAFMRLGSCVVDIKLGPLQRQDSRGGGKGRRW